MRADYSTITELPGSQITKLQLQRAYSRYRFAADMSEGKDVLEVACGGGQGLGLLATKARHVVGGDCDAVNLMHARETYAGDARVEVVELDAHNLQFADDSFDVILLYEALYYLKSPETFLNECRRVLRSNGIVVICTANKDWPDFNPSPFSHRYYSVPEMNILLARHGFAASFYGAFPDITDTTAAKVRSAIKRIAVCCHLMPKTMKGKVLLKKLFMGNMVTLPRILCDGVVEYEVPQPIPANVVDTIHTSLFAVGRLAP